MMFFYFFSLNIYSFIGILGIQKLLIDFEEMPRRMCDLWWKYWYRCYKMQRMDYCCLRLCQCRINGLEGLDDRRSDTSLYCLFRSINVRWILSIWIRS